MTNPREYFFNLPTVGRPEPFKIPQEWYPGVMEHWEKSTSSRIWDPLTGIKTVVIHATALGSSEGVMSVMKAHRASWHWLVPEENEPQHGKLIWACAPEMRAAWHVKNDASHPLINDGEDKTNHTSVGIEIICSHKPDACGTDVGYSNWQVEIASMIVRYCWAKYPNLTHIVSHALMDPDRRNSPGPIFPWDRFKRIVLDNKRTEIIPEMVSMATPMHLLTKDTRGYP